jgi:hypothetical protein
MTDKFKPGDIVHAPYCYIGIISDEVRADGYPAFSACGWPREEGGDIRIRWERGRGLYTSGAVKLHPDPDRIWADYCAWRLTNA